MSIFRNARFVASAYTPAELPPDVGAEVRQAVVAIGFIEIAEGAQNWQHCDDQIAWCQARGLRICGGPLVRLDGTYLVRSAYFSSTEPPAPSRAFSSGL